MTYVDIVLYNEIDTIIKLFQSFKLSGKYTNLEQWMQSMSSLRQLKEVNKSFYDLVEHNQL